MAWNKREVPGKGPWDCKVLCIGETPGRTDELKGEPFTGQIGRFVKAALRGGGVSEDEVRFNYAIPVNVKIPGDSRARQRLIDEHAAWLDDDLARCRPRVIVACGSLALQRLTGRTDITEEHGSVEVAQNIRVGNPSEASLSHRTHQAPLLVCSLHPSSAFATKLQASKETIGRVLTRAARYATEELKYAPVAPEILHRMPAFTEIVGARTVCIDTEYDSAKKHTFMVGLSFDGHRVYSITRFTVETIAALRELLTMPGLLKIAHFHLAEVRALSWLGIDVRGPWYDTMFAFNALYPDLPMNLGHVGKFYCEDLRNWKGMAHDDPLYNALDVTTTWQVKLHTEAELAQAGMLDLFYKEIMPTIPLLYGLEERGIQVDRAKVNEISCSMNAEIYDLTRAIKDQVDTEVFHKRRAPLEKRLTGIAVDIHIYTPMSNGCTEHPNYTGLVKPRGKSKGHCQCPQIYINEQGARDTIMKLRKERTQLEAKLKRWQPGFDPGNNDHLRWLLYDKEAFGLAVVRNKERRPTANATAIAKICARAGVAQKVKDVLVKIKRVQHLEKMLSTFADPPVDANNVAHPPYSPTTGTGRNKGGDDEGNEKVGSEYAFNALNIPEQMRSIFVAGDRK